MITECSLSELLLRSFLKRQTTEVRPVSQESCMDIIAWNIKRGGRFHRDAIASELITRSPDVIVLGEFVCGTTEPLIECLAAAGWIHNVIPDPPGRRGGVAIVSRLSLDVRHPPSNMSDHFRYAAVGIPFAHLELRGVYAPLNADPYCEFWEALLKSLEGESESPVLLLGDLNACLPRVDTTSTTSLFSAKYFKRLPACGYNDLWRMMNDSTADICTWQGPRHPYRLDHAFGTASVVPRVRSCRYDHSVRLAGLSDHSLLSISINVT